MNFSKKIEKQEKQIQELLANIKSRLPELEAFLSSINDHWCYEDLVYRLYHQSFKVYLRFPIKEAVKLLNSLAPDLSKTRLLVELPAHPLLRQILSEVPDGFDQAHNQDWGKFTRPIVEAALHLKYFIEMAVKYGKELDEPPNMMPSGWATLLYYYGLR